jgi:hypothetical protein
LLHIVRTDEHELREYTVSFLQFSVFILDNINSVKIWTSLTAAKIGDRQNGNEHIAQIISQLLISGDDDQNKSISKNGGNTKHKQSDIGRDYEIDLCRHAVVARKICR